MKRLYASIATLFLACAALNAQEAELYLFSGQSNMELPIRRCLDAVGEYVTDYSNDSIHYMKVPMRYVFDAPANDLRPGRWETLDPQTAQEWGALCYFVGKGLNEATGKEILMVNTGVGGTPIEAWTPAGELPEYSLPQLELCRDSSWLRETAIRSRRVYSDWQEDLDSRPFDSTARWKDVDIFSGNWATDAKGETVFGLHLLRTELRLDRKQASSDAVLHLGAIVDADSVFVNGVFVGNTTYRYPPRNYRVPASALRKGMNTIEIHLQSHHGEHASFVEGKRYSLETVSGEIPLPEVWEHKVAVRMPERDSEIFLQYMPSGLYNGMIYPLKDAIDDGSLTGGSGPARLKGVVWYQGESNIDRPEAYAERLETMIRSWRALFGDDSLPFYIVELAAYLHSELEAEGTEGWRGIQDAQRQVAEKMDNVYIVPGRDLGEWNDIHPQDKKTLGERVVNVILENQE